jgi:hypothetical protein
MMKWVMGHPCFETKNKCKQEAKLEMQNLHATMKIETIGS